MICPALGNEIVINGTDIYMQAASLLFQVLKCDNSTRGPGDPTCASSEEIDRYVKRTMVQAYSHHNVIDFGFHEGGPPL